jgi:pseudouridine synthase
VALIRIQKLIASSGLCSRRQAEQWIREGRVQVNGRVAALGSRADPEKDSVKLDGRRVRPPAGAKTYLLLNKPKGYVTAVWDPSRRDTVLDLVPRSLRRAVKPVGRLDVQTEGLLLLTDDGDLALLVTHPSVGCPKEYRVKVSGAPSEEKLDRLRRGIHLDGARTRPCEIVRLRTTEAGQRGNAWLSVVLREGRSRQIRRMFESIGHPVSKLKRVAIGPLRDDRLPPGAVRPLSPHEVESLKRSLARGGSGAGHP